jgi:hypothetical protein
MGITHGDRVEWLVRNRDVWEEYFTDHESRAVILDRIHMRMRLADLFEGWTYSHANSFIPPLIWMAREEITRAA